MTTATILNMEALKTDLVNIKVENYESKWYVPAKELERLLDPVRVRQAVKESRLEPYKHEEVTKAILQGGRKVFAVLLQICDDASLFARFMEQDHFQDQPLDPKLPFTRRDLLSILGQTKGELFYRERGTVLP